MSRPLVCYHCKQPGHHIRDCPTRPPAQPNTSSSSPPSSSDPQLRLKKLFIAIGEQSLNTVDKNLTLLSTTLLTDLPTHRPFILSTLLHSIKALPAKSNIWACLVSLLTLSSPSFAPDLLTLLTSALTHSLTTHQHDEARILIRFLLSLTHTRILTPTTLYSITTQLITFIQSSTERLFIDYYLYHLISLIPWAGLEHHTLPPFHSLYNQLDQLMQQRPPPSPLLRVFQSDDSEDLLTAYWSAVKGAYDRQSEVAWKSDLIMRPHLKLMDTFTSLNPVDLIIELPVPSSPCPALPPLLNLFPDHPLPPSLSPTSLSHYLTITLLIDTLTIFEAIHKESAKQLLLLPTGEDYSSILISLLFSSLFTLPTPSSLPLYYSAIIIDLFKSDPTTIPPIIGLAINTLFERCDALDLECFDRLVEWFTFHLSNFSYQWPWVNWSAVLETDEWTGQRVFVEECYEKMVRLSFWERVQQTVPEELVQLMPHQPIGAFRFGGGGGEMEVEGGEGSEGGEGGLVKIANVVMEKVREKVSNEELIAYLTSSLSTSTSLSSPLQLLLPCLLHSGQKSYSHLFALLDRYTPTLTHFTTPTTPPLLITAIAEYWQHSHQHVLVVLDKVMDKGWVNEGSVMGWVWGQKVEGMQRGWVWEVVGLVMDRVKRRGGGEGEGERKEVVRGLLQGLSKVLRVGNKNEGLMYYLESRMRGLIRRYRDIILPTSAEMEEVVAGLDARMVEAMEQAVTL